MQSNYRHPIVCFSVALALAGCGKKNNENTQASTAETAKAAPAPQAPTAPEPAPRKLSEAKVAVTSGSRARTIVMTPVGDIKINGEVIGALGPRGDLRIGDKTIVVLAADNTITLERDDAPSLTLAGANDGSLRYRDEVVVNWATDGKLSGYMGTAMAKEDAAMTITFEGALDMRLPMSVALLATMMSKGARRDLEKHVFEKIDYDKTTPEMIRADLDAICSAAENGKSIEHIATETDYKTRNVRNMFEMVAEVEPSKRAEIVAAGVKELGFPDWKCSALDSLTSAK